MKKQKGVNAIIKKVIRYNILILLTIVFLFTLRAIIAGIFIPQVIEKSFNNRDTVAVFENGKFSIGKYGKYIAFEDNRFDTEQVKVIINPIEEYAVKGKNIYIIGDYRGGGWNNYWDLKTGEQKFYNKEDPVPHYLILNLETDEFRTYMDISDMDELDRKEFEKLEQKMQ